MIEEIWKDIPNYEGIYQVSNMGAVKGVRRTDRSGKIRKGVVLKQGLRKGYKYVSLSNNCKNKKYSTHILVASAFLNHTADGTHNLVVNHKNFIKTDNRLDNLEIITQRSNTSYRNVKYTSKYVGVSWAKHANKWTAHIYIKPKLKHLGLFINEYDAHLAYQKALVNLNTDKHE